MSTPAQDGFRQPAEWTFHDACWVAWPSHDDLWLEDLPAAQEEFTQMCRVVAQGERLEVLTLHEASEAAARKGLAGLNVGFHRIPFGDIWLRDTAPVFVQRPDGAVAAVRFGFNGWGQKYALPHDNQVSERVAKASSLPTYDFPLVMEGGSIEPDGEGTLLTTRQCLLNPNRNPKMTEVELTRVLCDALGATKVLWLDDGLLNDHTDGHIDTIARFVAPGKVICMKPSGKDDPNAKVLDDIAHSLAAMTDAKGRTLEVIRIPSPGRVADEDGRVMPASYVNFYIGNRAVVVPTYGTPFDDEAVRAIAALFPTRKTVGISARAILEGGGAFHCITQQQPGKGSP